jgi:hypothetical protein
MKWGDHSPTFGTEYGGAVVICLVLLSSQFPTPFQRKATLTAALRGLSQFFQKIAGMVF